LRGFLATFLAHYQDGHQDFPWRVIQVGGTEGDLVGRDFLSRLGDKCREQASHQDWSWVHPGFGTDEWIIDSKLGLDPKKVGFVPGVNTATYKYYVDFAAKEGLPYIIVDDGGTDPNDK
jgi:alpha-glucosidase